MAVDRTPKFVHARLYQKANHDQVTAFLKDVVQQLPYRADAVLAKGYLVPDDVTHWSEINQVFHATIIESIGSSVIGDAIKRNDHLPFASADSIILDTRALDREYRKLYVAQSQHQTILQALRQGEGTRAEMLMREHAYIGLRYGELLTLDPPRQP